MRAVERPDKLPPAVLGVVALLAIVTSFADAADRSPLDDAAAVWHMADTGDSAGVRDLELHGDVRLGVPLDEAERAASGARGGDGKAARPSTA